MNDKQWTRRAFLAATTTTAGFILGGCATRPNRAKVVPRKISPNEKVVVGLIGLGGRCGAIADTALRIPQMRIAAVCDLFQPRIDWFLNNLGKDQNWNGYTDFQEMIEKEHLDGVMVETTTHARAWVTCHAMAAGMDAYIEKPMCLTIAEGRHMVKVARKYQRVTQVGTQQRSIPLNNWASDLVKNGALGKVTTVLAPNFVAPSRWTPKPAEPMPPGGSENWWDIWTNQAVFRPYHSALHRSWSRWWDYDGGGISFGVTGWGTHSYDQIQRGLGTDETGPVEVMLEEALREEPAGKFDDRQPTEDETGAPYYPMVKNLVGTRAKVRMRYANGAELHLHLDADRSPGLGCIFVGEKGRIEVNRDRISADPKELILSSDRPEPMKVPETQPHIENWIECIKTRQRCTADIEYGHRSTTLCYLVNIARDVGRVGETLKWDPVKERFTNCREANAMLSRPRRKGYELPRA
ncbi:MAG: Gfo/Idh/MocA family oxidoreductase [Candidatus Hydrogenedentes bacterium]|nr:Gfo/Idh/MocA family oxidoreductase [Candidatus Hydrogenedentota bacterium]